MRKNLIENESCLINFAFYGEIRADRLRLATALALFAKRVRKLLPTDFRVLFVFQDILMILFISISKLNLTIASIKCSPTPVSNCLIFVTCTISISQRDSPIRRKSAIKNFTALISNPLPCVCATRRNFSNQVAASLILFDVIRTRP